MTAFTTDKLGKTKYQTTGLTVKQTNIEGSCSVIDIVPHCPGNKFHTVDTLDIGPL